MEMPPPPPGNPMQFDKVEYATDGVTFKGATPTECVQCQRLISGEYFAVNGQVVCPSCKGQLRGLFTGGSKAARMAKAFIFGFAAMVISAIGYYIVRLILNSDVSIATIAMGWLIGWAVHRGASGRGGWFYQAAAVILTYCAIAFTEVPRIINLVHSQDTEQIAEGGAGTNSAEIDLPPSFYAKLLLFVLPSPIYRGMESPLLILIYSFGLWQAFSMNRRPKIEVAGPYNTRGGMATGPPDGAANSDRKPI